MKVATICGSVHGPVLTIKDDCSSLNVRQLKSRIEERTAARVVHVVSSGNVLNDAQMIGDTELIGGRCDS